MGGLGQQGLRQAGVRVEELGAAAMITTVNSELLAQIKTENSDE